MTQFKKNYALLQNLLLKVPPQLLSSRSQNWFLPLYGERIHSSANKKHPHQHREIKLRNCEYFYWLCDEVNTCLCKYLHVTKSITTIYIFVHDEPILKLIDCKFYVTISVVCGNFT